MRPDTGSALVCYFFFFQAEDGIRDVAVTGVQTCALPISTMPPPIVGLAREMLREPITVNLERKAAPAVGITQDRKSTRLNSSHGYISYAVFCLKKKKNHIAS